MNRLPASRMAVVVVTVVIASSRADSQTRLVKPAVTRSFGAKTANAPFLRPAGVYGAYKVIFPGTGLPPVRMDQPDGFLAQDRAEIAPGIEVRVLDTNRGDGPAPPPLLLAGRKQTVDFERFLTDPQLWSPEVRNDIRYQLGRGYFSKTAYRYFGLAKSHGKTYLGVYWYSPAASDKHDTHALVFRLDWDGKAIEPVQIRQLPNLPYGPSIPLLLDTLPSSDLVLSTEGKLWQMNENGEWRLLPVKWLKKHPQLAAYSLTWRRGRWLLTGRQREAGKVIAFEVAARDAATGRKVREFAWSVYP